MDVGGEGHMTINRAPFDTRRCLNLLGRELKRNNDPDSLVRGHVAVYGSGTQTDELMEAGKACADENDVTFNSHQSMSEGDSQRDGRPAYLHWADKGVLDSKCLFVHSNVIRDPKSTRMALASPSPGCQATPSTTDASERPNRIGAYHKA